MKNKVMKRLLALALSLLMILLHTTIALATEIPGDTTQADHLSIQDFMARERPMEEPEFISFSDYVGKYGESTVIRGFNRSEAVSLAQRADRSLSNQAAIAAVGTIERFDSSYSELYEELSSGTFLGMKVLGVSDIAPGEPGFLVQLDRGDYNPPPIAPPPETVKLNPDPYNLVSGSSISPTPISPMAVDNKDTYTVYYQNDKPSFVPLEPYAGSYFYKYSYSWGNYSTSSNIVFNNTQIKGASNLKYNAYTYMAAQSSLATLEVGLITAPATKRDGMYAYYSHKRPGLSTDIVSETFPRIAITSTEQLSEGIMIFDGKTAQVQIRGINNQFEILVREVNSASAFFMVINTPEIYCNQTNPSGVTFIHAMSYVGDPYDASRPTNMTSGAFFRNVTFKDPVLYSPSGTKLFGTVCADTYYVLVHKPLGASGVPANKGMTYNGTLTSSTAGIQY